MTYVYEIGAPVEEYQTQDDALAGFFTEVEANGKLMYAMFNPPGMKNN